MSNNIVFISLECKPAGLLIQVQFIHNFSVYMYLFMIASSYLCVKIQIFSSTSNWQHLKSFKDKVIKPKFIFNSG